MSTTEQRTKLEYIPLASYNSQDGDRGINITVPKGFHSPSITLKLQSKNKKDDRMGLYILRPPYREGAEAVKNWRPFQELANLALELDKLYGDELVTKLVEINKSAPTRRPDNHNQGKKKHSFGGPPRQTGKTARKKAKLSGKTAPPPAAPTAT